MHHDLHTSTVEMYEESNEDEDVELTRLAKSLVAHWLAPPGVSNRVIQGSNLPPSTIELSKKIKKTGGANDEGAYEVGLNR